MSLTVKINNTIVTILNDTNAQVDKTIDMSNTAQFTAIDLTGLQHWQPGQPVSITDSLLGLVFVGYIDNVDETNLYPNPAIASAVTCVGTRYLADKHYWSGVEFSNRLGGDIVTEFLSTLAQDGVQGQYVKDHASTYADWSTGTLTNVAPSMDLNGSLELAPAGVQVSATYAVSGGTFAPALNIGQLTGNTYTCASFNAIQYIADCVVPGLSNAYLSTKIWSGSHTLVAGDYLSYDIWINGNSPTMQAAVDIVCSDGTSFRFSNVATWDNQHIYASPVNSLAGLATNQWYSRTLGLNAGVMVGKTITSVSLVFAGSSTGHYVAYFRRIKIFNGATTIANVFSDTSTAMAQLPQIIGNSGYANMLCNVVTAYDPSGSIYSPIGSKLDMTPAAIYKSSLVSWQVDIPANCSVVTTMGIDSIDNTSDSTAVFLNATNNAPVPGLTPGQSISGQLVSFFLFMYNNGPDPTVTPVFHSLSIQVNPAYNATKSDYRYKIKKDADYTAGTLSSGLKEASNVLQINGFQANLTTSIPGNTLYGNANPAFYLNNRTLALQSDQATDVRLRMDFAGSTWADGVMELDVQVPSNAANNIGFVYRCTNWGTGNNTFAYSVMVSSTALQLGRGVNSTASTAQTFTSIQTATVALTAGDWHRLKVVFTGSSHQVYLDDSLFITATDATYTAAGYTGLRFFNGSTTNGLVGYVYNFGIATALSGTWTSPSFSLASVGTVASAFTRTQGSGDASQAALLTEISYDNGTTWQPCTAPALVVTNTGSWTYDCETIPGLSAGTSTASLTTCKLRITLTVSSVAAHLETHGTLFYVMSAYSATGQRLSRVLSIPTSIGRIGSATLSWDGITPTNTNILVESSPDGLTWSTEGSGATGAASIVGFYGQPAPLIDTFDQNSSSDYVNTAHPGDGTPATWYYDLPNSRLQATGGAKALYINNLIIKDGSIVADLDTSNGGGLVLDYGLISGSIKYYYLVINDSAATIGTPNTMTLYKQGSSTVYTLASASITFTHGTPHRFLFQNIQGVLTGLMDGQTIINYDDTAGGAPIFTGQAGLFNNGGASEFYGIYIQGLGDRVLAGEGVSTRVTLTSTDATVTPQLEDMAVSIRSSQIDDGSLIPSTAYSVLNGSKNTIAQSIDDLAKQSNTLWWIDETLFTHFKYKLGLPAPWIMTGDTIIASTVKVSTIQPGYRNVKWLDNAFDLVTRTENLVGNGQATSWDVGYPIESINSMLLDGYSVTFAPKGQSGANFYYEVGKTTITADPSTRLLGGLDTLAVNYVGLVAITVQMRHTKAIQKRAAIENTAGAVELVQDAGGINKQAALQFAVGLLNEFTQTGRQIQATTMSSGLAPGMLLPAFLPQFGMFDETLVITDVQITWQKLVENGVTVIQPFFNITAVEGAIVGDWTRLFTRLGKV